MGLSRSGVYHPKMTLLRGNMMIHHGFWGQPNCKTKPLEVYYMFLWQPGQPRGGRDVKKLRPTCIRFVLSLRVFCGPSPTPLCFVACAKLSSCIDCTKPCLRSGRFSEGVSKYLYFSRKATTPVSSNVAIRLLDPPLRSLQPGSPRLPQAHCNH